MRRSRNEAQGSGAALMGKAKYYAYMAANFTCNFHINGGQRQRPNAWIISHAETTECDQNGGKTITVHLSWQTSFWSSEYLAVGYDLHLYPWHPPVVVTNIYGRHIGRSRNVITLHKPVVLNNDSFYQRQYTTHASTFFTENYNCNTRFIYKLSNCYKLRVVTQRLSQSLRNADVSKA